MKTMWLLLLLSLPGIAHADSAETPSLRVTGSFFALSVDDLEASTRWYAEKLGLRIVMQVPRGDHPAVTLLEGDGLMVELVEHQGAAALGRVPAGPKASPHVQGMFKGGFLVEDFDRTLATLRARGAQITLGPFPARRDQRANAVFRDNAGNLIQVLGPYAP
jgi:catechol 2,3-dioxygenase-like lactoylglutathione lyase family enzyme